MMRLRTWLLSTTCLVAVAAAGGVQAAGLPDGYGGLPAYGALPAVSQTNGKLSTFGGSQDGGIFGVTGSLTAPLGHDFGVQFDGMVGSGKGAAFYGVGGHLFWRDPAKGLVGLYSSYVNWNLSGGSAGYIGGAEVGKIGAEGEAYLGRFSLEGLATYQFGTFTGFAGKALVAYYPTDNFRIDGGVRYLEGPGAIGMIDAEWQPHPGTGLTVYGTGSFGSNGYTQALGGVRFYFGDTGKSLIRRHREDDPVNAGSNGQPGDLYDAEVCPAGTSFDPIDGCITRNIEN